MKIIYVKLKLAALTIACIEEKIRDNIKLEYSTNNRAESIILKSRLKKAEDEYKKIERKYLKKKIKVS